MHQKCITYNNHFWGLYIYLPPYISNFQFFLIKPLVPKTLQDSTVPLLIRINNLGGGGGGGGGARKPVFEVSDKTRFKSVSPDTESS